MSLKPMLLIGGSGVFGSRIARLLRTRNPDLPLIIGGRDIGKARALADSLGNADGVAVDLSKSSLGLEQSEFSAVGLIAYDPTSNAMNFAARSGAPFLCITGGVFEFAVDAIPGMAAGHKVPVVIASHWFAGAVTMATLSLAERFASVDRVHVEFIIDSVEGSSAGPTTAADFVRIAANAPSAVMRRNGEYVWIPNDQAGGVIRRPDGGEMHGGGSVSCDVLSIGAWTGAGDISILEGMGLSATRAAGGPATDELYIRLSGRGADGNSLEVSQVVTCPRDPSTFTVISADIILERLAGLAGAPPLAPGLYTVEHAVQPAFFVQRMAEEGVVFRDA